ncbi:MAG: hypothetical protein C0461_05830 [Brevundimonas sp.]|nr:hypothetical protein [Brevundimonas sp.]
MPESIHTGRGDSPFGDKTAPAVESAGHGRDDAYHGGRRDDMVTGVAGGDGAGALKYNPVSDVSFAPYDRIMDTGADAFIDLRALGANVNVGANQSFTQVDELTGEAGQLTLTWAPSAGFSLLTADVDGDGVADIRIVLYDDLAAILGVGA